VKNNLDAVVEVRVLPWCGYRRGGEGVKLRGRLALPRKASISEFVRETACGLAVRDAASGSLPGRAGDGL